MTTSLIAPVIPSATRLAGHGHPRARTARRLPLASPPAGPGTLANVVYGTGRVDASGRVTDRAVTRALGWGAGDRLTLTASAGVVVARRDPGGMVTVPARPCVVIPAALRRRCGLHPGDRVLLAALPGEDALAVYSLPVVDQAIRAHAPLPHQEGGQP
jgi:bifunctional DNA-binding transcriptional regulator/antitoxin component of YhaV-PrlF toxin-antitoxin module